MPAAASEARFRVERKYNAPPYDSFPLPSVYFGALSPFAFQPHFQRLPSRAEQPRRRLPAARLAAIYRDGGYFSNHCIERLGQGTVVTLANHNFRQSAIAPIIIRIYERFACLAVDYRQSVIREGLRLAAQFFIVRLRFADSRVRRSSVYRIYDGFTRVITRLFPLPLPCRDRTELLPLFSLFLFSFLSCFPAGIFADEFARVFGYVRGSLPPTSVARREGDGFWMGARVDRNGTSSVHVFHRLAENRRELRDGLACNWSY